MEQHHLHYQRQIILCWNQIFLTLNSIIPLKINAYTPARVTRIYHAEIKFRTERKAWIHVHGDQKIHIQTPTSRRTYKQRPNRKPRPTWIFWRPTQPRIMATHHTPNLNFPFGRWFWFEIHRQSRDADHLINAPKKHYEMTEEWTGVL